MVDFTINPILPTLDQMAAFQQQQHAATRNVMNQQSSSPQMQQVGREKRPPRQRGGQMPHSEIQHINHYERISQQGHVNMDDAMPNFSDLWGTGKKRRR